jgi:hypothetical protein
LLPQKEKRDQFYAAQAPGGFSPIGWR